MQIIINIKAYHVKMIMIESSRGMGAANRSTTDADEDEEEIKRE